MDEKEFLEKAKKMVSDYLNENLDPTDNIKVSPDDVYAVYFCRVLQNNKAMLSTNLPDGMYYEVVYNGDRKVFYFIAYKAFNRCTFSEEGLK